MAANSPERWKQINHPRYGVLPFDISTWGRVRHRETGTRWKLRQHKSGKVYLDFFRMREGRTHHIPIRIATEVCRAFKRPRRECEGIEHIDGDKTNCRNDNLQYASLSQLVKKCFARCGWKAAPRIFLSEAAHDLIKRLHRAGYSQNAIARATGVAQGRISRIVNGKSLARPDATTLVSVDWQTLGADPKDFS